MVLLIIWFTLTELLFKPNELLNKLSKNSTEERKSEEKLGGCCYPSLKESGGQGGGVHHCNANVIALSAICGRKFN